MKFFIEIGSADFDTLIPLAEKGWSGVFIEPVETLAQNLIQKIKEKKLKNVKVFNYAISGSDGEVEMAQVTDFHWEGEQNWARGVSHISKGNTRGRCLLETVNDVLARTYKNTKCQSLNSLVEHLENSKVCGFDGKIDFLRVDAEGHELDIIEPYNWKIKPSLIKVEHAHCDLDGVTDTLRKEGYFTLLEEYDVYGIL
jgi:FkbM family methyltransferase